MDSLNPLTGSLTAAVSDAVWKEHTHPVLHHYVLSVREATLDQNLKGVTFVIGSESFTFHIKDKSRVVL